MQVQNNYNSCSDNWIIGRFSCHDLIKNYRMITAQSPKLHKVGRRIPATTMNTFGSVFR